MVSESVCVASGFVFTFACRTVRQSLSSFGFHPLVRFPGPWCPADICLLSVGMADISLNYFWCCYSLFRLSVGCCFHSLLRSYSSASSFSFRSSTCRVLSVIALLFTSQIQFISTFNFRSISRLSCFLPVLGDIVAIFVHTYTAKL